MSEIKTINGKVEFLCVPYPSEYEDRIRVVTRYTHPNLDPTKTFDAFLLSEITEEQASLLAKKDSNGEYYLYIGSDNNIFKSETQTTAKKSLFSLLKANDCWIKGWKEKPLHIFSDSPHEETSIQYQDYCKRIGYADTPYDYLLIIKQ